MGTPRPEDPDVPYSLSPLMPLCVLPVDVLDPQADCYPTSYAQQHPNGDDLEYDFYLKTHLIPYTWG